MKNKYLNLSKNEIFVPREASKSLPISTLLEKNKSTYNVDPPYQRGEAWKEDSRVALVDSIVSQRAINVIHVSERKDQYFRTSYEVIDGRQRLETIWKFVENEFKFPIELSNGDKKMLYWRQILEKSKGEKPDTNCVKFVENFNNYSLVFNVYSPLTVEQQKELFENINKGEPLTANERRYCKNMILKTFLTNLYKTIFKDYFQLFNDNFKNNRRFSSIRLVHELLYHSFGNHKFASFSERFEIKDIASANIDSSCRKYEEFLKKMIINKDENKFLQELTKDSSDKSKEILGIKTSEQLELCLKMICLIFENQKVKKGLNKRCLSDLTLFVMKKNQNEVFTLSFFCKNNLKDILYKVYKQYEKETSVKNGQDRQSKFTACSIDKKQIEIRMNKLEEIYNSFNLDDGEKNKDFPKDLIVQLKNKCIDKLIRDPFSGKELNNFNDIEIHHCPPKSTHSKNIPIPLHHLTNTALGNASPWVCNKEKIVDFYKNYIFPMKEEMSLKDEEKQKYFISPEEFEKIF